jgi:outer membrane lipoprotein-sorting protein
MRLAVLAALSLSSLCAQPYPDGAALVKRSESALRKLPTYAFDDRSVNNTLMLGKTFTTKNDIHMAKVSTGKARVEVKNEDDHVIAVSNGESTWIYSEGWHEYTRKSAVSTPDGIMTEMGFDDMMPHFDDAPTNIKTIGQESIVIAGQKHDCWVVEIRADSMELPGRGHGKTSEALMTHWFDKQLGLELQSTLAVKVLVAADGLSFEMREKTERRTMQIGGPVADSEFVFTPPEGAKEVARLSMFGGEANALPDLVGKPAPPISNPGMKGKLVLLEFRTADCAPCLKSADYREPGLEVISIDADEDRNAAILEDYHVVAFPTFVLIDRAGKVAAYQIGFDGEETLRSLLEKSGLR